MQVVIEVNDQILDLADTLQAVVQSVKKRYACQTHQQHEIFVSRQPIIAK